MRRDEQLSLFLVALLRSLLFYNLLFLGGHKGRVVKDKWHIVMMRLKVSPYSQSVTRAVLGNPLVGCLEMFFRSGCKNNNQSNDDKECGTDFSDDRVIEFSPDPFPRANGEAGDA